MKKAKLLLLLPLLVTTFSCNQEVSVKENIINKLLDGVNIKISGEERVKYPDEYSYLNKTTSISIDRDYKLITEKDGSKTPAVRENTNNSFTTYYKGKNGQAVKEVYTADNKVTTVDYKVAGMSVYFKEYFANPFEFVDESDISDDYTLSTQKANFIISSFTGLNYAVNQAKFVVENNVAKQLNVILNDRVDGLITTTSQYEIYNELDLTIKFNYEIKNIDHLAPRKEADSSLKNAFKNANNFTMTFTSDALTETCIAYVSEEAIFIHSDINSVGLKNGDEYYVSIGSGKYTKYAYSTVTNKFSLKNLSVSKSEILPDLTKISPNILVKESDNAYSFDKYSAVYGLEKMILPKYKVTSGSGIKGTLLIEDNHFTSLHAQFGEITPINITQNYYNYGNTSIPDWLDVSDL